MIDKNKFRLSLAQVYKACPSTIFKSSNTLQNHIEQKRAFDSLKMAINIEGRGYNAFALGDSGIGKQQLVMQYLKHKAKDKPISKDWVYIYNFEAPEKPKALSFKPSEAKLFKKYMDRVVNDLKTIIPSIFESEHYRNKILQIIKNTEILQQNKLEKLFAQALKNHIAFNRTQEGFSLVALNKSNQPFPPEDFEKLLDTEKNNIIHLIKLFQQKLERLLSSMPLVEKDKQKKIEEYNSKVITKAVRPLINKVAKKWANSKAVINYLSNILEYIIINYSIFLPSSHKAEDKMASFIASKQLNAFEVNIIVDRSIDIKNQQGSPIVYLDNPNYGKLFGKIEYSAEFGVLSTDFTNIKAGDLHKANGGYLIINARKLLEVPLLWESLKQVIKTRKIQFLTPESTVYNTSIVSLDPEPIPLDVKIILIGDSEVYYALWQYDSEFKDLFKIIADFDSMVPYTEENAKIYVNYILSFIKDEKLKEIDEKGLSKLVEIGARIADSQEFLTTNVAKIKNIIIEANYLAKQKHIDIVSPLEIKEAFAFQKERASKISDYMQKNIKEKIILVQTEGEEIGQINGLSVFTINDFMFGQPQRITSSVYQGKNGVVDIERLVNLSGSIHHKGIMILQSFLNARFGINKPLSFSATIVFEQSYGSIDGDSATSTELYALLSALSGIPINQQLAVTGSMDQKGRIQAIGGVNHKIEGFFKICKHNGLTGQQGVIIPRANIKDLMLDEDIIEAISNKLFNIYAISHVDEGIEILTGVPVGTLDIKGDYPVGTINHIIKEKWVEKEAIQKDKK